MNARTTYRKLHAPCSMLAAFTLVELLLVVAIMGIVAAITLPNLTRSLRGNRIRHATRNIITAGRYARNMSILRESSHALVFDIDGAGIFVSEGVTAIPVTEPEESDDVDESVFAEEESNILFAAERSFDGSGEFENQFEGVRIESVELGGDTIFTKGKVVVVFESNGRFMPYLVKLEDEQGKLVMIDVDALASVETEEVF